MQAERGDETARRGLEVALRTGELAGEPDARLASQGEVAREQARRVHERVAVHDAVAQELGAGEAGDEAEDARLLAEGQVSLETDKVVRRAGAVLGAQLNDRPRTATGARIGEADGFHRAEPDGG